MKEVDPPAKPLITNDVQQFITTTDYVEQSIANTFEYAAPISPSSILSPLRYPGAKRRLAKYIQAFFAMHNLSPKLLIEPFAGGASVALRLLDSNSVQQIGLVDRDPLVAAFWKTVFFDTAWLVAQVERVEISIEQWRYYKCLNPTTIRESAMKCLFLNRTSFSGIIARSGGPLGGQDQTSEHSIDCRFPRETIIKRIRQAASFRDRVLFVWNLSFFQAVPRIERMIANGKIPSNLFYYFDPPFFKKADRLYNFYFGQREHERLRDVVMNIKSPWLMSYDSAEDVDALYSKVVNGTAFVELLYGDTHRGGNKRAREVILSNLPLSIQETKLWMSATNSS